MQKLSVFVATIGIMILASPEAAWACEHCFGAAVDSMTTRGIAFAMAGLLGFTGLVGTGVVSFFRKMSVRARALEAGDLIVTESGDLIERGEDTTDSN